jgi:hypothetical protein
MTEFLRRYDSKSRTPLVLLLSAAISVRGNDALLMVQSAYVLDPSTRDPGRGSVRFKALMGHALRGTKPRPPP